MRTKALPTWADDLRTTYLRGESAVFLLHGNVFDLILHEGKLTPLADFLTTVLLKNKDVIVHYNVATGVKFVKKDKKVGELEGLVGASPDKALKALENLLVTQDRVAIVMDYAEMVVPAGDVSYLSDDDRQTVTRLHRWSLDRRFDNADNVIVLVTEQLSEVHAKLVSNPKITTLPVPLPDEEERLALIGLLEPDASEKARTKLAQLSAGLKNVQIRGILSPGEDTEEDLAERRQLILRLLGDAPNARERAEKLAKVFVGQTADEIKALLRPEGAPEARREDEDLRYADVYTLLAKRKREILEKECFGLVEFVEPRHDLSDVGGMEGVKKELMNIARNIKDGVRARVPMGLLFTGPMGSGKTFVAEAFARSSGLTAIKLKNFRSKWVGSTEGNLEKILSVVRAIGNILVIIDEGDRAFGNTDGGDGDGGTSSRVIARIKEFMSDPENRGRVLFVMMTNRPDKLDIDIKRAGRLDRKIPFFYAWEPEEIELVMKAQLKRHKVEHGLRFPEDRGATSERLRGYSNADIEAVILLANDIAHQEGSKVTAEVFGRAVSDYLPSRDAATLEYMEIMAVLESSSRTMLPKRYHDREVDELQARARELRPRM